MQGQNYNDHTQIAIRFLFKKVCIITIIIGFKVLQLY